MDLVVRNRNSKVTERQRHHIEEKLSRLDRYMDGIGSATVEVSTEQRRNAGEVHRVQVTLVGEHGVILRAEESAPDLYTAIDEVQDVLQRQIKRYKEKHWRRGKGRRQALKPAALETEILGTGERDVAVDSGPEEEEGPQILRTKRFTLIPMSGEEAVEQMELLGHTFFLFRDADTSQISVVYRRKDGNYGLIVPDEAA